MAHEQVVCVHGAGVGDRRRRMAAAGRGARLALPGPGARGRPRRAGRRSCPRPPARGRRRPRRRALVRRQRRAAGRPAGAGPRPLAGAAGARVLRPRARGAGGRGARHRHGVRLRRRRRPGRVRAGVLRALRLRDGLPAARPRGARSWRPTPPGSVGSRHRGASGCDPRTACPCAPWSSPLRPVRCTPRRPRRWPTSAPSTSPWRARVTECRTTLGPLHCCGTSGRTASRGRTRCPRRPASPGTTRCPRRPSSGAPAGRRAPRAGHPRPRARRAARPR